MLQAKNIILIVKYLEFIQKQEFERNKTKKTASFEAVFVPGAGVEPARFPTGV